MHTIIGSLWLTVTTSKQESSALHELVYSAKMFTTSISLVNNHCISCVPGLHDIVRGQFSREVTSFMHACVSYNCLMYTSGICTLMYTSDICALMYTSDICALMYISDICMAFISDAPCPLPTHPFDGAIEFLATFGDRFYTSWCSTSQKYTNLWHTASRVPMHSLFIPDT